MKDNMDPKEAVTAFPFMFMLWNEESVESLHKEVDLDADKSCWKFDSSINDKKNRCESWTKTEVTLNDRSMSPSTTDSGFDSASFDTSLNNSTDWNPNSPTLIC